MRRFTNAKGEWGTLCPDWPGIDDLDIATVPPHTIAVTPYDEDRKYDPVPQTIAVITLFDDLHAIRVGYSNGRWFVVWPVPDFWRWMDGELPDRNVRDAQFGWHDPLHAADMARRSAPFLVEALVCLAHLRAQQGGEGS